MGATKMLVPGILAISIYLLVLEFRIWEVAKGICYFSSSRASRDRESLHGLLPIRENDRCQSRLQRHLYYRAAAIDRNIPSTSLARRLRSYEDLHARCAPNHPQSWDRRGNLTTSECKFVVWINFSGLGNKMVSIAATFLYALLTDRVLLIDPGEDMANLFCEPFPRSSWLVSREILNKFALGDPKPKFDHRFCADDLDRVLGSHLSIDIISETSLGENFFCERQQRALGDRVAWLSIRSSQYYAPSLYAVPRFKAELDCLFPAEQETVVFHHLGRYLFSPSNSVWDQASRFYKASMADSSKLIGIQMRQLAPNLGLRPHSQSSFAQAMIQCLLQNSLFDLPSNRSRSKTTALVTSLDRFFFQRLRNFSLESDGVVRVLSPGHEESQRTDNLEHDEKALAEMVLLSMCDELVTSPGSTFGYVAQGLAGIKPWLLLADNDDRGATANCSRLISMDPCFHAAAPYGCDCKRRSDPRFEPNVRSCQDVPTGIQLIGSKEWRSPMQEP
ncbi:fucosyltransferase 2-like [Selaginella moellendorffii]|uniref:fucosyltransferase 2-like n=1 Tax=Selaginella moellendorffii TaxID=88036 RepID=UPI000D1CEC77|nr:fucosyltransferase 2-like [Selaginella moellendorffii]|eukprot:XP_024529670.1 fucosyltransferase 2-like [Selaginella moellendorffii]